MFLPVFTIVLDIFPAVFVTAILERFWLYFFMFFFFLMILSVSVNAALNYFMPLFVNFVQKCFRMHLLQQFSYISQLNMNMKWKVVLKWRMFSFRVCFWYFQICQTVANAGAVECLPSANPTSWLQGVRRFEEVKALCMEMDVMISPVWWNMKMYLWMYWIQ